MENFDIIIIGAGAAGMMSAQVLSAAKKHVCILEARDRIGGRIHTISPTGFSKPIEAGAEFVHGKLPITLKLLQEAGIKYYKTDGQLWQLKNGELTRKEDFIEHADQLMKKLNELDDDISIAEFMEKYFPGEKYADMKLSLQQYIEGYEAADINYFSALALKQEWETEDDQQYRMEGGYLPLLNNLKNDCLQNSCTISLNTVVKKINWEKDHVEVVTNDNDMFLSKNIIITVPPILLTGDDSEAAISFTPALPVLSKAARQIGYGGVIKIVLEFTHAFWETGEVKKAADLFFVFSEEKIPTWWSQLPDKTPTLCGWLAGPKANDMQDEDDDTILEHALCSLSHIFAINTEILQQYIKGSHVRNWVADPYSKGAYSYNSITSAAAKKILATPVANTIFIAGEALSKNGNATVEAALNSGADVAEMMLGKG